MKRIGAASALLIGVISVSGCMIVDTPVMGVLGSRVRWGEFAQGDDKARSERGKGLHGNHSGPDRQG